MTFMPGLGGIIQQVADLAANGDLVKDQDKIEELKKALLKNAGLLEDGDFKNVELAPSAFGASAEAEELGRHHTLAHTIVTDTMLGVVDDLLCFRDGVEVFERHVDRADGDAVFSPRLAGFVLDAFSEGPNAAPVGDPELDLLTPREREVLRLLARGYAYKEIASELFISVKTVETHVSSVLRKTQLSNRYELSRWASDRRRKKKERSRRRSRVRAEERKRAASS